MQNNKTLIIGAIAVLLLILVAAYFIMAGDIETAVGASVAAAATAATAKKARDLTRVDVQETLGDVEEAHVEIKELLDKYEEEKSANVEEVMSADNEEKRAMGLAVLSPEMLAALDVKPEDIA